MVTTLLDFRKNIVHITISLVLSKSRTELGKGGVSGVLLDHLSKALDCILFDLFNAKLCAHSLYSHIQRIGDAYFGFMKLYLEPC